MNKFKQALTRKIGPLPAWAWLALLTGVLLYMRSRTASSTAASGSTAATAANDTAAQNALAEYQAGEVQGQTYGAGGTGGGYGGGYGSTSGDQTGAASTGDSQAIEDLAAAVQSAITAGQTSQTSTTTTTTTPTRTHRGKGKHGKGKGTATQGKGGHQSGKHTNRSAARSGGRRYRAGLGKLHAFGPRRPRTTPAKHPDAPIKGARLGRRRAPIHHAPPRPRTHPAAAHRTTTVRHEPAPQRQRAVHKPAPPRRHR